MAEGKRKFDKFKVETVRLKVEGEKIRRIKKAGPFRPCLDS
ncbi:MAG: hypothetical protein NT010_09940 [Proteobacteria bacterium]|nr:hypothetical protein [Pseudomonadota bacterium]